jgi:hypothetical protein
VDSSESNGLVETFKGTFKATTSTAPNGGMQSRSLAQLGGWLDDYNTQAAHSAGMRSAADYRAE